MTTPTPRAVRVRVAVAVDPKTHDVFSASSASVQEDDSLARWVRAHRRAGYAVSRHETEAPLPPSPETVAGEVAS